MKNSKPQTSNLKPKVAFFDFACCEGCQLTVVDSLQTHLDLLNEARLEKIRAQADIVVALGACAHLGGVNALKNLHPLEDVRRWVYGDKADWYETYAARPIGAVIEVDAVIPGCPIDREEFIRVVKAVLLGKKPPVPDYPVCVECKLKENVCLFHIGKFCLGPVARAGCDAICPTYGDGCEGCRGLIPHPNENAMQDVLAEAGLTVEEVLSRFTMFNTYQVQERAHEALAEGEGK
jgi:sulfhydrogenase subunit delta